MKNTTSPVKSSEEPKVKLSSKELNEIEFRITAALNRLYDQSPFYYHFLKSITKKFDFKNSHIAYVAMEPKSKRIQLFINPIKTRNFSVVDYCILLQHETLHICYEHLRDDKFKKSNTAIKFNQACDYILNDNIPELVQRYPKIRKTIAEMRADISKLLFDGQMCTTLPTNEDEIRDVLKQLPEDKYKEIKPKIEEIIHKYEAIEPFALGCTKPAIEHKSEVKDLDFKQTTSEELYHILFKNKDGEGEGDKGQMTVKITMGSPNDDHQPIEDNQAENHIEFDELAKEEIKKMIKDAAQDALQCQKSFGNMPDNLTKELFELLKSKTNYMQVIQSFATSVRDSDSRRTWTKQHRKYPNQTPGRKREYKPTLVMGLDTSGSMWSDKIQQLMVSEIKALKEVCDSLILVMGDTREAARIDLHDKDFNVEKFKLQGGGGTDLQFIFDAAKELKADGIIAHSDGYIGNIQNDYGIQTMWFIYPQGQKVEPEKYKNYLIDECL